MVFFGTWSSGHFLECFALFLIDYATDAPPFLLHASGCSSNIPSTASPGCKDQPSHLYSKLANLPLLYNSPSLCLLPEKPSICCIKSLCELCVPET